MGLGAITAGALPEFLTEDGFYKLSEASPMELLLNVGGSPPIIITPGSSATFVASRRMLRPLLADPYEF